MIPGRHNAAVSLLASPVRQRATRKHWNLEKLRSCMTTSVSMHYSSGAFTFLQPGQHRLRQPGCLHSMNVSPVSACGKSLNQSPGYGVNPSTDLGLDWGAHFIGCRNTGYQNTGYQNNIHPPCRWCRTCRCFRKCRGSSCLSSRQATLLQERWKVFSLRPP